MRKEDDGDLTQLQLTGSINLPQRSRFNTTFTIIPSIDSLKESKGFTSFYGGMKTSPDRQSPSKSSDLLELKTPISKTLSSNRQNLSTIRRRLFNRRKTQYDQYVSNSMKYQHLLELNNNRSKILTSLNKHKVGEVKVTVIDQKTFDDLYYQVAQHEVYIDGWKPESREGQTCVAYQNNIVLLGGHNNSAPLDSLCLYNCYTSQWTKLRQGEMQLRRTYHSSVLYKNHYIIVFGGMGSYNSHYRTHECLNSCCLIGLSQSPPSIRRIKVTNELLVEARRCHSAIIIGKNMLVFGGINTKKDYLRHLAVLDLKELKWSILQYRVDSTSLEQYLKLGLAKHCAFSFFQSRQNYPLYSKSYSDIEGMYVFGGNNQAAEDNKMLLFSLRHRLPKVSRVEISGYPPSTIQPSVCPINNQSFAIVSGERGERQLRIFRVREREYMLVTGRYGNLGGLSSSLVNVNNYFYIVFGLGDRGYIGDCHQLKIQEKYKERAGRRRTTIDGRRPTFFARHEDDGRSSPQSFGRFN